MRASDLLLFPLFGVVLIMAAVGAIWDWMGYAKDSALITFMLLYALPVAIGLTLAAYVIFAEPTP